MNDTDTVSSSSANQATAIIDEFGGSSSSAATKQKPSMGYSAPKMPTAKAATSAGYFKGEVTGDASVPSNPSTESGGESNPFAEVGTVGNTESGGDTAEASAEALAANHGRAVLADLPEGYQGAESGAEAGAEGGSTHLAEVGEALAPGGAGNEEFLPLLAAVVPTLLSTIGPPLAKAVMKKVSPTVKRVITTVGQQAPKVLPKGTLPNGAGALIQTLMRLLQQNSSKETGAEFGEGEGAVDEAFAAEVAQAMEVIIGNDDRIRITATTSTHWRRVCALRITFPNGAVYRGTGFFIGRRAVATAGHCVYLASQGGWARSIEVIPGMNDSTRPFGTATSSNLRSVTGWTQQARPECDYGCIVLPENSFGGVNLGAFGFAALSADALNAQAAVLGGYPGDKPFAQLWGMSRKFKTVNANTLVYDIDTMGGQSGAPVYVIRNNQRCVVGIHNYGAASGNSATRITPPVYSILNNWSAL
ncbi:MAG: trypsin-like serine peptidase [Casimicrobium sp.]